MRDTLFIGYISSEMACALELFSTFVYLWPWSDGSRRPVIELIKLTIMLRAPQLALTIAFGSKTVDIWSLFFMTGHSSTCQTI